MLAWLHAPQYTNKGKPLKPRLEGYRGKLPEAGPLGYLLEYLKEIGPAAINGGLPQPVSWQEIDAWQRLTGTCLDSFEAQIIRELSGVYVQMYVKSQKPECPPPWTDAAADSKAAISERVKNLFRS